MSLGDFVIIEVQAFWSVRIKTAGAEFWIYPFWSWDLDQVLSHFDTVFETLEVVVENGFHGSFLDALGAVHDFSGELCFVTHL